MIGTRLGEYEIVEPIEEGGMADVWKARTVEGEIIKTVALKLLPRSFERDQEMRERFRKEAKVWGMLSHSNIVKAEKSGRHAGLSYIVMEWVDGPNLSLLREWMKRHGEKMPIRVAAYIVSEVASGLSYAHEFEVSPGTRGVIHRDVSPQNVLVSVSGEVKLTDFGIAKMVSEYSSIARPGEGKPQYAAPEQITIGAREPTVDIFSLGAILHELLTGERFRGGMDHDELQRAIVQGTIPVMTREGVPDELEALRVRLLDPDPQRRPPNAEAVIAELERALDFRSGKRNLAEIVKRYQRVSGPRSGLHPVPQQDATPAGLATLPGTMSRRQGLTTGKLLGLSAALILVGVGLGAGGWALLSQDEPAPVARTEPAPAPAREPAPPPEQQPEPRATQTPKLEPEPETKLEPEATPRPETAKKRERKEPAKPKAKVRFLLDGPQLAYARIDGRREFVLEPLAKGSVKPGRHRIEWRLSVKHPWKDAGKFSFEPGKSYDVDISDKGVEITLRE